MEASGESIKCYVKKQKIHRQMCRTVLDNRGWLGCLTEFYKTEAVKITHSEKGSRPFCPPLMADIRHFVLF
jgi:hypothetical protein